MTMSARLNILPEDVVGPKATKSLVARRNPLAPSTEQLRILDGVAGQKGGRYDFEQALSEAGWPSFHRTELEYFQINVGKLCNMTCMHCHVDAGPDRVDENMDRATIDACLAALDQTTAHTVDITGGAPELNPNFRYLVDEVKKRGKHVIDRCNLTILLTQKMKDLPEWFAEREVEVVCSLPHCSERNTDAQRGDGTYERSIEALKRLNAAGYGQGDPKRVLTLMSNPSGAFLAGNQANLEREWKRTLERRFGVRFDRLFCLNNMPIARFLEWLIQTENLEGYLERLVNAFNPASVHGVMCRNTMSISWDGYVYDCDFNQMLELDVPHPSGPRTHIREFDSAAFAAQRIVTAPHCFGCTAGAGSSCGGATGG